MAMNQRTMRPRLPASTGNDPPGCTQSAAYLTLAGADSGTTFTDSSVNKFTVTRSGSVVTSTAQSPYDGGSSAYFPGTGSSYLQLPSSSALNLGSAEFTVELWFRTPDSVGTGQVLTAKWGSPGNGIFLGLGGSGVLNLYVNNALAIAAGRWAANTWHHVAMVRKVDDLYLYMDGKQVAPAWSVGGAITDGPAWRIGYDNGVNQLFSGYIADYRIVKGLAVYDGPFTPPSSPVGRCALVADTNAVVEGCTDYTADNYDSAANVDDGSCSFTPPSAPDAPTNVSATAGDQQVALTWDAPASDGGSAITDYAIEFANEVPGSTWYSVSDGTSTDTSYTVTGLTNDIIHVFRVAAINSAGQGDWSAESGSVQPTAIIADAPTGLGGDPYSGYIQIYWSAPASAGSRPPVHNYEIEYSTDAGSTAAGTITASTTSDTISSTTDGTSYHFRVRATTDGGALYSDWSEWYGPLVYATVPSAPDSPTAYASDGSVSISWGAPASDGGSAIVGYDISRSTDGVTFSSLGFFYGSTSYTDTSVSNGTSYYYRVAAGNSIGTGASADTDNGNSVTPHRYGCTDSAATNYDSTATADDGSCTYPVYGCTDPSASNYDPSANTDDGSCTY
jgi:hypothetical protein